MERKPPYDIRPLRRSDAGHREALRLIVSGQSKAGTAVDRRVAELLTYAESPSVVASLVFGAFRGEQLVCACLYVQVPGRTALAYLPPSPLAPPELVALPPLLRAIREHAWSRGVAFAQVLVAPEDAAVERALEEAGFCFLAELLYQDRPADAPPGVDRVRTDLTFQSHCPETHPMFIEALHLSYTGSLDCPKLTGLRDAEDVLATHKASGDHDPNLWFIVRKQNRLLGLLLLSKVLRRSMLEVVYMGVSEGARGQGVGDALLVQAAAQCVRAGASWLTLAVDSGNAPALRLYRRWGFVERSRRRAWVAIDPNLKRP